MHISQFLGFFSGKGKHIALKRQKKKRGRKSWEKLLSISRLTATSNNSIKVYLLVI